MSARCWGLLAVAFVAASPAFAQGTISKNAVQFVRNASCWDTSPSANFLGVSNPLSQDHLFEVGWWFRVAGDTQETAFPAPDTQSYVGDTSSHTWNDVGGRGLFSAEEHGKVFDYSAGSPNGLVTLSMSIYNLSSTTPLEIDVFNMADFDLQPNAADDSARLVEWTPNRILEISDAGGNFAQYIALGNAEVSNHFLMRPFGANDVAALLSDAAVTDFDDSLWSFGPGDFTGGWQFTMTVQPGEWVSASVYLAVNISSHCYVGSGLFCDSFERGDSSVWSSVVP